MRPISKTVPPLALLSLLMAGHALSTAPHGDHILIAWRHKKIPAMLKAFDANPALLLPDGVWPDSVFDWVILLQYDAAGHLQTQKLIHEPEPLP